MVEKNKGFQVGAHIVMIILSLCCIFPFLLLIVSSITDEQELIRNGYTLFPKALSLNAYQYMFKSSNKIISAYGITILSTVVGTVCGLSMTILMAYPLSRRDLPGRNGLAFYVFFTMLFSGGLVPTYIMYTRYIKVSNTIWALIIPSLVVNAFYVIMMRTYFSTQIPRELREAAQLDGCAEMRYLVRIVLPLSVPILAVVGLYYAVGVWNSYFDAMVYLSSRNKMPLTVFLREILILNDSADMTSSMDVESMITMQERQRVMKYSLIVVSSVPMFILYPFVQKYFVQGIMIGSVKG